MKDTQQFDQEELAKQQALSIPHNLCVTDKILKLKNQNGQIQITLGWETPAGGLAPSVTLVLTKDFARQIAEDLQKASE